MDDHTVESVSFTCVRLDDGAYVSALTAKVYGPHGVEDSPRRLYALGTRAQVLASIEGVVTWLDGRITIHARCHFDGAQDFGRDLDAIVRRSHRTARQGDARD